MGDVIAKYLNVNDEWLTSRTCMLEHARRLMSTEGWVCGNAPGLVPIGLMTGLSGIGLGLLSSLNPEKPYGILTLETKNLDL